MTNIYATLSTLTTKIGALLIRSHPILNNYGDSRIQIYVNKRVGAAPCRHLKSIIQLVAPVVKSPAVCRTSCFRSSHGLRTFHLFNNRILLGRTIASIRQRNSQIATVIYARVRANHGAHVHTTLFTSYDNSNIITQHAKTALVCNQRDQRACNRHLTPRGTSELAVNRSVH